MAPCQSVPDIWRHIGYRACRRRSQTSRHTWPGYPPMNRRYSTNRCREFLHCASRSGEAPAPIQRLHGRYRQSGQHQSDPILPTGAPLHRQTPSFRRILQWQQAFRQRCALQRSGSIAHAGHIHWSQRRLQCGYSLANGRSGPRGRWIDWANGQARIHFARQRRHRWKS